MREFDKNFGPVAKQRFFERIYDLAQELCLVLKACPSGPQPPGAAPLTGRTIFLAETTADLRADRDSLRRELAVAPSLAWSPQGDHLASGGADGLVEAKSNVEVFVPGIDGGEGSCDWLTARILYREAEGLIAGNKAEQPK